MRNLLLLLAPIAFAAGAASLARSEAPSFSCAAARTEVERTICANPDLSREDAVMARLYVAARRGARGDGQSSQGAAQIAWLRSRSGCESGKPQGFASRAECLTAYYRDRNLELATAGLFSGREEAGEALATLHRLDPNGAPLVEALTLFAIRPASSNWNSPALKQDRARIAELIGTSFAKLGTDTAQGYGREVLSSEGVSSLDDALKSPSNFAQMVKVLATYTQGARTPLLFPCELILHQPAMIELQQPLYGSSLDNFLPESNCAASLSPAPRLDALKVEIWKSWPECEGSMRYLFYRSFKVRVDAALLGQPIVQAISKRRMPQRNGISEQLVASVRNELAARYVAWGYTPGAARATARERLVDLLSAAHKCD